jgi:hypothetical protein
MRLVEGVILTSRVNGDIATKANKPQNRHQHTERAGIGRRRPCLATRVSHKSRSLTLSILPLPDDSALNQAHEMMRAASMTAAAK